jgi:protein-S-isoprenylcysteine O-methyltransferase Ste14
MPEEAGMAAAENRIVRLGRFFFRWRGWTAVPLALLLVLFAKPTAAWAISGAAAIVAGEAVRLRALRYIGGASRSRRLGAERLVTEGPFANHRNPLYCGNFLLTAGFSLLSGRPWFLLVPAILFPVQYWPIVIAEETALRGAFGDRYEAYARRTPRFVPRRTAAGEGGAPPSLALRQAIRADRSTLRSIVLLGAAVAVAAAVRGG